MPIAQNLEDVKDPQIRAFLKEWATCGDQNSERATQIAMDVFEDEDADRAEARAYGILQTSRYRHVVRVIMKRQALTTPKALEDGANEGIDFLRNTMTRIENNDEMKESAPMMKVGVDAAKGLLAGYVKSASGAGYDQLEMIKERLPEGMKSLIDMDPEELMALESGKKEE